MTPEEGTARRRFAIIAVARFAGVIVMLVGLAIWHGNIVRPGGAPLLGTPLFVAGMLGSLIVPLLLGRRWRSPRR